MQCIFPISYNLLVLLQDTNIPTAQQLNEKLNYVAHSFSLSLKATGT